MFLTPMNTEKMWLSNAQWLTKKKTMIYNLLKAKFVWLVSTTLHLLPTEEESKCGKMINGVHSVEELTVSLLNLLMLLANKWTMNQENWLLTEILELATKMVKTIVLPMEQTSKNLMLIAKKVKTNWLNVVEKKLKIVMLKWLLLLNVLVKKETHQD